MDNHKTSQFEWGVWVKWVIATTLSFLINDGTQLFFPMQSIFAFLYILFLDGLIIAVFQWLFVLRSRIPKANLWILCSTGGWAVGWLLGHLAGAIILMSLFIHGIILGMFQWAFFIRKLYSKSFLWILVNAIGLPFAYGLSWYVIFPITHGDNNGLLSGPEDSAIRGALFGSVTGAMLIWLSHFPRDEMDSMR